MRVTGPHSLLDMPHPLAGSSSEEAVGGDSTPSPDLLMARSFGDKVGRAGLGTGRRVSLSRGMVDPELSLRAPGRAHPGARARGRAFPGSPEPSENRPSRPPPRGRSRRGGGRRGRACPAVTGRERG